LSSELTKLSIELGVLLFGDTVYMHELRVHKYYEPSSQLRDKMNILVPATITNKQRTGMAMQ